jgi:hypothetical protein
VANHANANIVKILVDEERGIVRLIGQRVALVASSAGVEQLPSACGAFIDGGLVAGNLMIERGIGRDQRTFI